VRLYLDNVIFSLQRAGGVSVYWSELLKRFLASDDEVHAIEQKGALDNLFRKDIRIDAGRLIQERGLPTKVLRYLSPRARLRTPSIFHSSYYRTTGQRGVTNVVTVYDFAYEYYYSRLQNVVHGMQKRGALARAAGIICISRSTQDDLLRFFPHLASKPISVIYLGVGAEFEKIPDGPAGRERLPGVPDGKFVVYVGGRAPQKNFELSVEVVARLPDTHLVVVGGGPFSPADLQRFQTRLPGRFHHLGSIDNRKLNLLYNSAFCLLYPSVYEGFGIPVIEAMRAGCPVVASNVSSIPEAAGDAAIMASSIEAESFVEGVRKLEDDGLRKGAIERGLRHSALFSWDRCYAETLAFYRRVSAGG
jgi:mannosyltransferase